MKTRTSTHAHARAHKGKRKLSGLMDTRYTRWILSLNLFQKVFRHKDIRSKTQRKVKQNITPASLYRRKKKQSDILHHDTKVHSSPKEAFIQSHIKQTQHSHSNHAVITYLSSWKGLYAMLVALYRSILTFRFSNIHDLIKTYSSSLWSTTFLIYVSKICTSFVLLASILFLLFVSFFDTSFVITQYHISFAPHSYIDSDDMQTLLKEYNRHRQLALFPLNSYFLVNDFTLTSIAQKQLPFVRSVQIIERQFPTSVTLYIETQPILATLAISIEGQKPELWRVGTDGRIIAKDELLMKEQLVSVQRTISFDKDNANPKDINLFYEDKKQLDRLYFIYTIQDWLEHSGYQISTVSIPSINPVDYEVHFTLSSGSEIWFDYSLLDKTSLLRRINEINRTSIKDDLTSGAITYVDARLSRNLYICYVITRCESP